MLKALVESAERFSDDMAPLGYEATDIRWVIDIDSETGLAKLLPYMKGDLTRVVPIRGDRSGQASDDNSKPALLVDRAQYALGICIPGKEASAELVHTKFKEILSEYASEDSEALRIKLFLDSRPVPAGHARNQGEEQDADFWKVLGEKVKPSDMVAFRSNARGEYPFDKPQARQFWARLLKQSYEAEATACSICGQHRKALRILPWQMTIEGQSCPVSSFNGTAFESFGKKQLANSPICFECGGRASRLLQYLIQEPRYSRLLAKDDSPNRKSPLRNQLAIFWLKEMAHVPDPSDESVEIDLEELLSAPLRAADDDPPPPAEVAQIERLLAMPWKTAREALRISTNSFFLGVLSPNKSRLVIRDWLEESIDLVWEHLGAYERALRIVDPDGARVWAPSIGAVFSALKPEGVANAGSGGDLLRGLLRTAYKGFPAPAELLSEAVRRFRMPDKKARKTSQEMQQAQGLRRMALAGAMKLALHSGIGKAEIMEELNHQNGSPPYLCGRLLSILEEAQLCASHRRINTTLVDRCYGTASTSPGSIFGPLLNLATKAHFPKLRKEYGGAIYRDLEPLLEDVLSAISAGGGFASGLNVRQQAEFGLGFYQQRSCFRKLRAASLAARTQAANLKGTTNPPEGVNNEPHGSR